MLWEHIDWQNMLTFDTPLLEIFIRGTLCYIGLFVLLRLFLKRQSGGTSVSDLLVVVLIADAAQNGMAGDYKSVPDGLFLVATILFWCVVLDWLGYRYPLIGRFVHPPPLVLVKNGELNRRNLRRELLTFEELMSQLREQGVSDIEEVKQACMEGNGHISVVRFDGETRKGPKQRPS